MSILDPIHLPPGLGASEAAGRGGLRLSGDRRNEWSVPMSANWRIAFEERDGAIERLNREDHHR